MNLSIKEIEKEIIEEFELFDNWVDKYEYLIDLGKSLPKIEEHEKTNENIISGCQSQVWLNAKKQNNEVHFFADSDAIMTKGIIAILIRVLSHQEPKEIINANLDFINTIGLKEQLSPTRANGLVSMIKKMKIYALGFEKKL
ncbi:SufE family protein [Flavobacteriales bacterium]|jgi:cysteine desulfuration protein SufE|nr:SufE family protein [Flavobacteriales bacterium]|tara:strand:+ start:433 stop:858 length:426 start_codon:yes stop_codon:yes gene_type:complete